MHMQPFLIVFFIFALWMIWTTYLALHGNGPKMSKGFISILTPILIIFGLIFTVPFPDGTRLIGNNVFQEGVFLFFWALSLFGLTLLIQGGKGFSRKKKLSQIEKS